MFCVVNSILYSALLGQTHKFTELSAKVCQNLEKSFPSCLWMRLPRGNGEVVLGNSLSMNELCKLLAVFGEQGE